MKASFFILILSLLHYTGYSQVPNEVNVLTTPLNLNYSYSNVNQLASPQILTNALKLTVKVKVAPWNVYATVSYPGCNLSQIPDNWLSLQLTGTTSTTASVPYMTKPLPANTQVLLFTQPIPPGSNGLCTFDFDYNLIINPTTTFLPTNNYNYTITFTMTQS